MPGAPRPGYRPTTDRLLRRPRVADAGGVPPTGRARQLAGIATRVQIAPVKARTEEAPSRSARGPGVGREDRARGRHLAVDELQRPRPAAAVPEDALAGAQDDRVDHQPELVDKVVLYQRLHQLRAAEHVQIAAVLLLQRGHGLGDVALEHGRVLPGERFREG